MAISLLAWIQLSDSLNRWLVALGGVAVGGVVYFAGAMILKVPEIKLLTNMVSSRIKRV
jgi:hypothetical protein